MFLINVLLLLPEGVITILLCVIKSYEVVLFLSQFLNNIQLHTCTQMTIPPQNVCSY